jgi:hypothetical protein
MFRTITLLACLAALAACSKGKKDGASCGDVGASFLALGQRQLDAARKPGTDDKAFASVETHLPAMRDSMVLSCKDGKWSPESRGCFAAATDDAAMMSCYETLGPEQRALLDDGRDPKPRK